MLRYLQLLVFRSDETHSMLILLLNKKCSTFLISYLIFSMLYFAVRD